MNNLIELKNINLKGVQESFMSYLDVSELTCKSYRDGIRAFIEYLEDNNIKKPTRLDFKAFRDSMKDTMSIHTINTYLTSNRAFFKYLADNGIYENITLNVKNLKTSTIPVRQTLTLEKCKEISKSLTDKREKLMFDLAITTGLRANEIALAKIENIKEYNGEIVLFVKCKKRDDEREYVKLPSVVLDEINEYINGRTNGFVFISTSNNNKGGGVTNTTVRRIVKSILRRFGYDEDGFSCHSLRRTMATISFDNGADIVSIQQVLHQKSIATTRRYIQQKVRDNNKLEYNVANTLFN